MWPAPLLLALLMQPLAQTLAQSAGQPPGTNKTSQDNSNESIDQLLSQTFQLLDTLDQKVTVLSNKTSAAIQKDNRRLSAEAGELGARNSMVSVDPGDDDEDQSLIKMAERFSSRREHVSELDSGSSEPKPVIIGGQTARLKLPRQLVTANRAAVASESDTQTAPSSFTESHIRFTLDLMQAIFAKMSPGDQHESFLISPVSIQTVLMLMHLGARGQTRRELANCLHLMPASLSSNRSSLEMQAGATSEPAKLKRRHQVTGPHQVTSSNDKQQSVGPKFGPPSGVNNNNNNNNNNSKQRPMLGTYQHSAHEHFGAAMRNLAKDPSVAKAFTSANQLFLQRNLPLASQYELAARHYYATELKTVDFQTPEGILQESQAPNGTSDTSANATSPNTSSSSASSVGPQQELLSNSTGNVQQMINEWVEQQTRGKIANFLTAPVPSSTLMLAINALFFKGDWQYKFDPSDTEPDAWFTKSDGKTVRLPMMVGRLPLAHWHDPLMRTSVIELPYKAQRLGLFLLLPDEATGLAHTLAMLNSSSLANLISSMRKPSTGQADQAVNVRLPKFQIDSAPRLSQILSHQLGLKSLLSPDLADLSGMFAPVKQRTNSTIGPAAPQVGLDELVHKAVIQVDEQGSVAAASSAAIVERVGLFNGKYFEADHPFLLFLMDKQTGLVLFSGLFAGDSETAQPLSSATGGATAPEQKRP